MRIKFEFIGEYRSVDSLQNKINYYNDNKQRAIFMKSADVNKSHETSSLEILYRRYTQNIVPDFQFGDRVIIFKVTKNELNLTDIILKQLTKR